MELASRAHRNNEMLWLLNPKSHMLTHLFKNLGWEAELSSYALNPVSLGVQMDEDLIGKTCRLNRRVHPTLQSRRTLQRTLCAAYASWQSIGMIKEAV